MNVSLRYQTHSRGRCTSSTSYSMGETTEYPCASFTGVLARHNTIDIGSTIQLWLSADHPLNILTEDADGNTALIEGVMLYTSEFNPPLRRVAISRSSWVEEDDLVNVELQAFSNAFALRPPEK